MTATATKQPFARPIDRGRTPVAMSERKRQATHESTQPEREPSLSPSESRPPTKIISQSPKMAEVFHFVRQVATVDTTVLVTGESGTGKELIAEAIHAESMRSEAPFVTINMAAVPEALVESELFGHVKGAFTGAGTDRIGRFEAANGGTIFIDEIGDLQTPSQAKLLRVLENRVVTPVGGNGERAVNARVVAATNRPLEKMIDDDEFREDLYYRLNVVRIALPPLRDRDGDVPLLVKHFVHHFCKAYKRPQIAIDDKLMAFLNSYPWPGNVRELRNCVESMVVLTNSDVLTIDDIPPILRQHSRKKHVSFDVPDNVSLAEIEETVISETLQRCDGNRTRAAQKLDISVRTLQRRLARNSHDVA